MAFEPQRGRMTEDERDALASQIAERAVLDITASSHIAGWRGLGFRRYADLESAIYGFLMEHAIFYDEENDD